MAPKRAAILADLLASDDSSAHAAERSALAHESDTPPPAAKASKPRKRKPASKRLSSGRSKPKLAFAKKATSKGKSSRGKQAEVTDDEEPAEAGDSIMEEPVAEEETTLDDSQLKEPSKKRRGRPPKGQTAEAEDAPVKKDAPAKKDAPVKKNAPAKKHAITSKPVAEDPAQKRRGRPKKAVSYEEVEEAEETEEAQDQPVEVSQMEQEDEGDQDQAEESQEVTLDAAPLQDPASEDSAAEDIPPPPAKPVASKRSRKAAAEKPQASPKVSAKRKHAEADLGTEQDDEEDTVLIRQKLDDERLESSIVRRKLETMTKKFDALQDNYKRLEEIGIQEAAANFDLLSEQAAAQDKAASDLIDSLKGDLETAEKALNKKDTEIKKANAQVEKSEQRLKDSEAKVSSLTTTLTLSQSESKSLQAKLAATRNVSAEPAGRSRVPGSAAKGKAAANVHNADQAVIAQMKEDMYSDLTSLIIRHVNRGEAEDVYDCLQTGRNGTLHFQLAIDKTDSHISYDENDFTYRPRFDPERDSDLIEILPEYLQEEITFSRNNASKFYSRIWDTLTRKLE